MSNRFERVLFACGLAILVAGYGYGVGRFAWPPAGLLERALFAARDWQENWRHYLGIFSKYARERDFERGGVLRYDRERAFAGLTLVTAFTGQRFEALLLDMDGDVVHRWHVSPGEIFGSSGHVDVVPDDWEVNYHGAALRPDGTLFVNTGGVGLVAVDACGQIRLKVAERTHHDVDLLPDGDIVVPNIRLVHGTSPDRPGPRPGIDGYYQDETVLWLDPEGRIRREYSILDAIYAGGLQYLLTSGPGPTGAQAFDAVDLLHNNTAEVLREEMAAAFPLFEAGDILVSPRHLNTILVIDGETGAAKWAMTGPFIGQHDPDFLPNGHILLYDNRKAPKPGAFGSTRIVEIDPATKEVVWSWTGEGRDSFYNGSRGEQTMLPNGNILFPDVFNGRVLEIDRDTGDVVWEWVNLVEPGVVGIVIDVERYREDDLTFLDRPCS